MKNSGLIGLKVANDGLGLRKALEAHYPIISMEHIGNFVFKAICSNQVSLEIHTKPVDLAQRTIRIVDIQKLT